MIDSQSGGGVDLAAGLVESWAVNECMNQTVLEHLDPAAWRATFGKVRSIAAIVTHMHNVRRKWLRLSAPHIKLPAAIDRARCTREQAIAALAESANGCAGMIADALADSASGAPGRVRSFVRDGWARPWAAGAEMVAYMIAHEAHHRGQICMLAHQLGLPLSAKATSGMWAWERLSRGD